MPSIVSQADAMTKTMPPFPGSADSTSPWRVRVHRRADTAAQERQNPSPRAVPLIAQAQLAHPNATR